MTCFQHLTNFVPRPRLAPKNIVPGWQKPRRTLLAPGQLYGSPAGEYRDCCRMLRRVTLTTTTAGPLAVRQIASGTHYTGICLRARKSFAALPCNHPFAAKHMLLSPRAAIYKVSFGHDSLHSSTGI